MNIEDKSRVLFMKYAIPCAGTLVSRGNIKKKDVDVLIDAVKNNKSIPKDTEKVFKVAFSACSILAMDAGKKKIDADVIHDYYLFKHDKMIDMRYEEMGDFDPDLCRIRPGVVKKVLHGIAIVENSAGSKKYRTNYCDVKEGDLVVTHWDFVIEKISRETAEKMLVQKKKLRVI
ncbi:MAG: hypothetical protein NT120_04325 [Candidatus Aenigmarchaeota archaeon]|nr:hypothetical protein [Candidatus Aenigmarchaeota archaeon]